MSEKSYTKQQFIASRSYTTPERELHNARQYASLWYDLQSLTWQQAGTTTWNELRTYFARWLDLQSLTWGQAGAGTWNELRTYGGA